MSDHEEDPSPLSEGFPVPPTCTEHDRLHALYRLQYRSERQRGEDVNVMTSSERLRYLRGEVLSLCTVLYRALEEVSWRNWTQGEPRVDEYKFGRELIQAQRSLVNLFLAVGWDTEDMFLNYWIALQEDTQHDTRS